MWDCRVTSRHLKFTMVGVEFNFSLKPAPFQLDLTCKQCQHPSSCSSQNPGVTFDFSLPSFNPSARTKHTWTPLPLVQPPSFHSSFTATPWPSPGHVTLYNQDKSYNVIPPRRNLQWLPSALKIKPKDLVMRASLYMRHSRTPLWPCLLHHAPFHCVPATPASTLSVISPCQAHSHLRSLHWLIPGPGMLFLWNMHDSSSSLWF